MKGKPVAATEAVAVYLRHRSDHRSDRATYNAFMPANNGRRSVYRIDGLDHHGVRQLGADYVEPHRGPLRGYATQFAAEFYGQGLDFVPDGVPHERHANAVNWSDIPAKNRIIAEHLARDATLVLYATTQ